jgi:hypothetical protein
MRSRSGTDPINKGEFGTGVTHNQLGNRKISRK